MLNEIANSFGSQQPPSSSYRQGFAYVFLPPGTYPENYRLHCINNGTVSIIMDKSIGYVSGVLIPKNCVDQIEFPESTEQLGSMVFFNTVPSTGQPVIVNVYERPDNVEIKYKGKGVYLNKGGTLSGVLISENGDITVACDGDASLTIRSTGGGDLEINSSDSLGIAALNQITIGSQSLSVRCTDEEGRETNFELDKDRAKLSDSDGNIVSLSSSGVDIESKAQVNVLSSGPLSLKSENIVSLNEGSSSAVLGDVLLLDLQELLVQMQALNTATGAAIQALLPSAAAPYTGIGTALAQLQAKLNLFLSKTVLLS